MNITENMINNFNIIMRIYWDDICVAIYGYNSESKFYTDFINEMRNVPTKNPEKGNLYEKHGEHDLKVFFMFPAKYLPYGWEREYTSIMDIPHTHAIKATLEIPINADSVDDCVLDLWK